MKKVSVLLVLALLCVPTAFAADPPPGSVVRADYLRPCLNTGSMTTATHEYKCVTEANGADVYHFVTKRSYTKDVYRVDRTPLARSEFVAYAVKQTTQVSNITEVDDAAALVYSRKVPQPVQTDNEWTYKAKN